MDVEDIRDEKARQVACHELAEKIRTQLDALNEEHGEDCEELVLELVQR